MSESSAPPPRITYLVLAHHKPAQFGALVRRLTRSGSSVVAHIDAKSDEAPFRAVVDPASTTFAERRYRIRWAGFSSVLAELGLLATAARHHPADYYVLLSGVDYPIRPEEQLREELRSGATYMNCWAMPSVEHNKPMWRLEKYVIAGRGDQGRVVDLLNRHVLPRLPTRNVRRGLGGHRPFGGSVWWALPHGVAQDVLRFAAREHRFVRFFRWAPFSDEMFFQTVVQAVDGPPLRPAIMFTDWSRPEFGTASPATLSAADVELLRAQSQFFARKFDLDRDPELFDVLDRELLGR
ncbi:hypothetical protein D9V37_12230 [Nocardioides mangrovicus]|uniref:Peptide O-xylosyltransferase n=1 Tax=Nocardioides mangrovicus TaxID=2478913 RepID=A0A3L8P2C1_9ACTN|nr:beta-1,6-N-acetylglucosaminyltransferase [Nocardioides mangrovicus]RLV49304.1 hypothetical protein D9V37_12230 [Nocardioides mangrovicus]